jgi:hypothetical protein
MRRTFYCLLLVAILGVPHGRAQTPQIQQNVNKKLDEARAAKKLEQRRAEQTALEQLIGEALKNNPDIRLAETKVHDAEAELMRTRMKVLSDVTLVHTESQAAQAAVDDAAARYQQLEKAGTSVSKRELEEARQLMVKNKAALAVIHAKLPYLLGRPGVSDIDLLLLWRIDRIGVRDAGKTTSDEEYLRRITLDLLGRLPTPEETKDFLKIPEKERREKLQEKVQKTSRAEAERLKLRRNALETRRILIREEFEDWLALGRAHTPPSPLTDKLRKALDAPVRLQTTGMTPPDVLDHVRDTMLNGVNLVVRKGFKDDAMNIQLKEPIPVGAFLEYLQDELGVVFVLRDYGIVVVGAGDRLPPGAVDVVTFWKSGRRAPKESQKDKK